MSFIRIASAVAATVGAAQAGIIALPLDDYPKAVIAFCLGLVATFFSVLLMEEKINEH